MKTVKTISKRTQVQGLNQTKDQSQTPKDNKGKNDETTQTTNDNKGEKDDSQLKSKDNKGKKDETNQTSKDNKGVKNEIIPDYDEKKKLSDEISSLCTDVLVLTQMVNNMNIEKGKLIKQYKTVITKIQTSFQIINDDNFFRTKHHIF